MENFYKEICNLNVLWEGQKIKSGSFLVLCFPISILPDFQQQQRDPIHTEAVLMGHSQLHHR